MNTKHTKKIITISTIIVFLFIENIGYAAITSKIAKELCASLRAPLLFRDLKKDFIGYYVHIGKQGELPIRHKGKFGLNPLHDCYRVGEIIEITKGLTVGLSEGLGTADILQILRDVNILWVQAQPEALPIEVYSDARRNGVYLIADSLKGVSELELFQALIKGGIRITAEQRVLEKGNSWGEDIASVIEKVTEGYIEEAVARFWEITVRKSKNEYSSATMINGIFGGTDTSQTEYFLKEKLKLDEGDGKVIGDIGSGAGDFCFAASKLYPKSKVIGIELSSGLAAASAKKKIKGGFQNVDFINLSALSSEVDYSLFDVIYMYNPITRNPLFFEKLTAKLVREMKPGAVLICYGLDFEEERSSADGIIGGYEFPRKILLGKYKGKFDFKYFYVGPGLSILEVYTKKPEETEKISPVKQINARIQAEQWLKKVGKFNPAVYLGKTIINLDAGSSTEIMKAI